MGRPGRSSYPGLYNQPARAVPAGGFYPGLYNQPTRAVPARAGGFYGNFVNPACDRYPGLNARLKAVR
jgi:hypothetical protein